MKNVKYRFRFLLLLLLIISLNFCSKIENKSVIIELSIDEMSELIRADTLWENVLYEIRNRQEKIKNNEII